jgi:hypothetical protein
LRPNQQLGKEREKKGRGGEGGGKRAVTGLKARKAEKYESCS